MKNYLNCYDYLLPQGVFSTEFEGGKNASPKYKEVSSVWCHLNKAGYSLIWDSVIILSYIKLILQLIITA